MNRMSNDQYLALIRWLESVSQLQGQIELEDLHGLAAKSGHVVPLSGLKRACTKEGWKLKRKTRSDVGSSRDKRVSVADHTRYAQRLHEILATHVPSAARELASLEIPHADA